MIKILSSGFFDDAQGRGFANAGTTDPRRRSARARKKPSDSQAPGVRAACLLPCEGAVSRAGAKLFLALACEMKDAGKKNMGFLDYFDAFKTATQNELTQRKGLSRLNDARVSMKHYGTWPNRDVLSELETIATLFFRENSPRVFSVDFDSVSMVDFIECAEARSSLREAESHLGAGKYPLACRSAGVAVAYAKEAIKASVAELGGSFWPNTSNLQLDQSDPWLREIEGFARNTEKRISDLQKGMADLATGIDRRDPDWRRFSILTPAARIAMSGKPRTSVTNRTEENPTKEDAVFCLNFAVEVCMRLERRGWG